MSEPLAILFAFTICIIAVIVIWYFSQSKDKD